MRREVQPEPRAITTTRRGYEDLVLLCGPLRSGTTLLRLLLQQHSGVTARGESDYYLDATARALRAGRDAPRDRAAFARHLRTERIPRDQGVVPPPSGPLDRMTEDLLDAERPSRGLLLLTFHRNIDLAARRFPGARIVRLRRDPRDVAVSAARMGWGGTPYQGVRVWLDAERCWPEVEAIVPPGDLIDLRFEDLVRRPEATLRRVLGALDLPFEAGVLSPSGTSYADPSPRRAGAWREALSGEEAREVVSRLGRAGERSGYDVSDARPPTPRRRLSLWWAGKAGAWRRRVARHGPAVALADRITARMPAGRLRAMVARRVEAGERAALK